MQWPHRSHPGGHIRRRSRGRRVYSDLCIVLQLQGGNFPAISWPTSAIPDHEKTTTWIKKSLLQEKSLATSVKALRRRKTVAKFPAREEDRRELPHAVTLKPPSGKLQCPPTIMSRIKDSLHYRLQCPINSRRSPPWKYPEKDAKIPAI